MILTSTDIIRIVTSSNADIHVNASWVDITTTTFTPSRTNTIISATSSATTIVGSPGASTQRQIKSIVMANRHATLSNIITIQFYDSSNSISVYSRILLVDESIEYDGTKWTAYSSDGYILQTTGVTAAGTDTQIQFNDGGTLMGADADFAWNKTTNALQLLGTNTGVDLKAITTEPSVPGAGILHVYSKSVAGKIMLKQVGPSGLDTPLQNAIWQNNTVLFTPGAAAGVWQGTVGANVGTPTIGLPVTTNVGTMLRKSIFPTTAAINIQAGTRTEAMFYRGDKTFVGGFHFSCRFMFSIWNAGNRLFVGFSTATTALTTANPSTLANILGFGVDAGDSAITFMHCDASAGTAIKDAIAGQPALATNNAYAAYIFCKPNDSVVYYRLDDLTAGTTIIDSSASTKLPVNTTALIAHCANGSGSSSAISSIGINRIYIETDI